LHWEFILDTILWLRAASNVSRCFSAVTTWQVAAGQQKELLDQYCEDRPGTYGPFVPALEKLGDSLGVLLYLLLHWCTSLPLTNLSGNIGFLLMELSILHFSEKTGRVSSDHLKTSHSVMPPEIPYIRHSPMWLKLQELMQTYDVA